MRRRFTITIAVLGVLAMLTAGCGSGDDGDGAQVSDVSDTTGDDDGTDDTDPNDSDPPVESDDGETNTPPIAGDTTGISDETITVGVLIWTSVADVIDAEGHWQVYFDDLNARGGIDGRRVEPVYQEFNNSSVAMTEACLALTEDNEIFAVLVTNGIWGPGVLCHVERHETPLLTATVTGTGLPDDFYDRAEERLFTLGLSSETAMDTLVRFLDDRGEFDGKQLGVIGTDAEDPEVPTLDEFGIPYDSYMVPLSTDSAALIPPLIDAQEAAGVDGVIITTGAYPTSFFMNEYAARDYRPTFYVTGEGALDYFPATFAPGVFDGALALATTYTGWQRGDDPTESDRAVTCRETFETISGTALEPGSAEHGNVMQTCDLVSVFEAGASAAAANLTREGFSDALQGVGEIDLASQPAGSFGPGKFTAADQVRLLEWKSDCGCYEPISDFQSLDG